MRFPYSLNIARSIATGDEIVVMRPEVPIRIHAPAGAAELLALVDTGADNSIFPLSIANALGIATTPSKGPSATTFGGQEIALNTVILGHEGFLDYFTATFEGEACELILEPNFDIPVE